MFILGDKYLTNLKIACMYLGREKNLIVDITFQFALDIITYSEELGSLKKFNVANQLFRSGTSIDANVSESQNAHSRNDFIHKLKIAAKEAEETRYWLNLCEKAKSYPNPVQLHEKITIILKILNTIIETTKANVIH
jgi:four helix bundle protein